MQNKKKRRKSSGDKEKGFVIKKEKMKLRARNVRNVT
jgi:hypothetical protein